MFGIEGILKVNHTSLVSCFTFVIYARTRCPSFASQPVSLTRRPLRLHHLVFIDTLGQNVSRLSANQTAWHMQRIVSSAQDRDSGTATQKPLPLSPSPNGDHTGSDYWQPIRRDGSPSGSASKASSSAFTTPQLETTQDHVRIPPNLPIHPEFQSFLTLDATHRSKVYLSNRLFMKTDGSTSRSQGWSDVWAQLMGNTLSLWRMNEIEAARKEGRSILPRTLSVTDAVSRA